MSEPFSERLSEIRAFFLTGIVMHIAKVKISNFRGIKLATIDLPGHCVLVGANNVGKTTLIEALALVLGRDRMVKSLTEHDFFGSNPEPADRIAVIVTVSGFDSNEVSDYPEWFSPDRGIPKWLDSNNTVCPSQEKKEWPICVQIGYFARFDREELVVESIRCFVDDDNSYGDPFDEPVNQISQRVLSEVGFFLVPASRTWDKMMSFASDLFSKVIKGIGKIPSEAILAERDRLRKPEKELDKDENIKELIDDINEELKNLFTTSPQLKFRITSTDSASTLQALIPHFTGNDPNQIMPSSKFGTGLISVQSLMLLLQMGKWRKNHSKSFCLAIEEPELHITTSQQRRLIHRLQSFCTQSIFTTHSVAVACLHRPNEILFIHNSNGTLTVRPLLEDPLKLSSSNNLRKLFHTNKSITVSALTHEMVLIPEGRCDFEFLTALIDSIELVSEWSVADKLSFGTFIGPVLTDSARILETYLTLRTCHDNISILVDGDSEGQKYISEILKNETPPRYIFCWHNSRVVEDIIGWIIGDQFKSMIAQLPEIQVSSLEELVVRLKSKDRSNNGLKEDYIAYRSIVSEAMMFESCRERAAVILSSMTQIGTGIPVDVSNVFEKDEKLSTTETIVLNFKFK